ncbi:hypothetical protein FRC14_008237 [Serendipita sp. 396]|nr:hypothetical protein FRC14_008237 [Serendipita sp. 396]KAG8776250.1 hypothetical protein FRC15_012045 [Serendipita sp. 397]KAG8850646.1 hypothetical protein FRC20_001958 [Serendipita sp. 405]
MQVIATCGAAAKTETAPIKAESNRLNGTINLSNIAGSTSANHPTSSLPPWAPQFEEIESSISRCLRLSDQLASLRHLRHPLTLMHARLVHLQHNSKHARVILKRLLPHSTGTTTQMVSREKIWSSYEAHLTIIQQYLHPSESTTTVGTWEGGKGNVDVPTVLSQLNALAMLANQYGDTAVEQLVAVIRFTVLFQNYEDSYSISHADVDMALVAAEGIIGLSGFDKQGMTSPVEAAPSKGPQQGNHTPGSSLSAAMGESTTPLIRDVLANSGTHVVANLKTPAFSFPTNPLGMNVYSEQQQQEQQLLQEKDETAGEKQFRVDGTTTTIPPYLGYLRIQTLMLSILWLTHCGHSARGSERLTLLHEMMDKLSDMSRSNDEYRWMGNDEPGVIQIPLYSNKEQKIRLKVTHPRVLYQLTFAISASAKRDGAGRRPKRKIFSEEGLRIGQLDDPRNLTAVPITDGGFPLEFAPGLGIEEMRQARLSIAHVRATILCELVSVCITRSEFDDAERYLNDAISFLRAVDTIEAPSFALPLSSSSYSTSTFSSGVLWNQFSSKITLLHAHLAHALDRPAAALECYQTVMHLEDESRVLHGMARAGEMILRIGLFRRDHAPISKREEEDGKAKEGKMERRGENDGLSKSPAFQELFTSASEVVERCLQGVWGEGMVVVGRLLATALTDEVVRAKQNLKSALDLSCRSRDNYLRLAVLIFSASQYVDTSSEYATKILESTRQLASSLGAVSGERPEGNLGGSGAIGISDDIVGSGAGLDGIESPTRRSSRGGMQTKEIGVKQYHVGNARAGLWIGQRFSELYKRSNDGARMAKQNALNVVFEKAIEAMDQRADGYLALLPRSEGTTLSPEGLLSKNMVSYPVDTRTVVETHRQPQNVAHPYPGQQLQGQPHQYQYQYPQTQAQTQTQTQLHQYPQMQLQYPQPPSQPYSQPQPPQRPQPLQPLQLVEKSPVSPTPTLAPTRTLRHTRMLRGSTVSTLDPFSPVETRSRAFHGEGGEEGGEEDEEEEEDESVEGDRQWTTTPGPPSTAATTSTNGRRRGQSTHSRSQSQSQSQSQPQMMSQSQSQRSRRSGSMVSHRSTRSSTRGGGGKERNVVVGAEDEEDEDDDLDGEGEDDDGEWEED